VGYVLKRRALFLGEKKYYFLFCTKDVPLRGRKKECKRRIKICQKWFKLVGSANQIYPEKTNKFLEKKVL
tara:strand:- start:268 stop:477 length:210 start_codon:yes stop_codon:yes gene_type:complete